MQEITVGFSRSKKGILSKLIRLIEGTPYSHVYMRRNSKYGEYVYQASGLQVNFTNIKTFLEDNVVVEEYNFNLDEDKKDKLIEFFIKYSGISYSFKTLFKILAIILLGKIGIKVKFRGDGDSSFICSELGAVFCEEILGIDLPDKKDFITPKNLYPYIVKFGSKID